MKLNFSVNVTDYDDDVYTIESAIVTEAAKQLITEVMGNRYEHYGRTFKENLQNEIRNMMLECMNDKDFKEEIKNSLVDELSKKYIKSKQYKEVKEQFNILSDTEIKKGLKDIISELVNMEIKKRFK